jgi:hypothetical protein
MSRVKARQGILRQGILRQGILQQGILQQGILEQSQSISTPMSKSTTPAPSERMPNGDRALEKARRIGPPRCLGWLALQ